MRVFNYTAIILFFALTFSACGGKSVLKPSLVGINPDGDVNAVKRNQAVGGSGSSTSTITFAIGDIYISSTTFKNYPSLSEVFVDSVTIAGIRWYTVYTSTVDVTTFNIQYSSQTSGDRIFNDLFNSDQGISSSTVVSNWLPADVVNIGIGLYIIR